MEINNVNNIRFETAIDVRKTKDIISKAVTFLCSNFDVDVPYFDFLCIVSTNFIDDKNFFHGKPDNNDNSNGIFIPTFYQSENTTKDKDIVIINWKKISHFSDIFIISVFIHEFSHFLDFRLCPTLEKKYNIIFGLQTKYDSLDDIIGGFFCMRSEMRAKYIQEKYEYVIDSSKEYIIEQIKLNATKVESIDDTYAISHLTGQFLCWNELSQSDTDILNALQPIKNQLIQIWDSNPQYRFDTIFTEHDLIKKCDEIYKELS